MYVCVIDTPMYSSIYRYVYGVVCDVRGDRWREGGIGLLTDRNVLTY